MAPFGNVSAGWIRSFRFVPGSTKSWRKYC